MSKTATMDSVRELTDAEMELAGAWAERLATYYDREMDSDLDEARSEAPKELLLGLQRVAHHARTGGYAQTEGDGRSPMRPDEAHTPEGVRRFAEETRASTARLADDELRTQDRMLRTQTKMRETVQRLKKFTDRRNMTVSAEHKDQHFSEDRLFFADFQATDQFTAVAYKKNEDDDVLTCTGAWGKSQLEATYKLAESISERLLVVSMYGGKEIRVWTPPFIPAEDEK